MGRLGQGERCRVIGDGVSGPVIGVMPSDGASCWKPATEVVVFGKDGVCVWWWGGIRWRQADSSLAMVAGIGEVGWPICSSSKGGGAGRCIGGGGESTAVGVANGEITTGRGSCRFGWGSTTPLGPKLRVISQCRNRGGGDLEETLFYLASPVTPAMEWGLAARRRRALGF